MTYIHCTYTGISMDSKFLNKLYDISRPCTLIKYVNLYMGKVKCRQAVRRPELNSEDRKWHLNTEVLMIYFCFELCPLTFLDFLLYGLSKLHEQKK
jgi:hypothetical protein